ncbi:hypothetical protein [Streptomyces noursei]|uniref:hypothetical protein n=1 Tax=Streptomyces noursei TaxID=1971 RepID=UPI00045EEA47|nr:hypothetical protein [Streptomyces noursei]AIA03418.1 hypothetical protein DC74_2918 [Streptomyces noursei]
MTEEQPLIPRTQRPHPRRDEANAPEQHQQHHPQQPLDQVAPHLAPPWAKEDTDTPERTTAYTHPEGHRIGLRLMPGNLTIQTWITAGAHLPPIPAGTAEEKAEAQATNDARLQPGRSWHVTVGIRSTSDLPAAITAVLREQLLPALTHKPKRVHIGPKPPAEPESEPTTPPQKPRRTARTTRTTKTKEPTK